MEDGKEHMAAPMRIVDTSNMDYEFGPGQKIQFELTKGRHYKSTFFSKKPLYPLATTLEKGDKVVVKGWIELYGRDEYIQVYGLRKL